MPDATEIATEIALGLLRFALRLAPALAELLRADPEHPLWPRVAEILAENPMRAVAPPDEAEPGRS